MIATFLAVATAFTAFWWAPFGGALDSPRAALIFLAGGSALLLGNLFLRAFAWAPLAYLEQTLVPGAVELARRDRPLRCGFQAIWGVVLLSYLAAALAAALEEASHRELLLFAWLVLFGVALDLLHNGWSRLSRFLHPSYLLTRFSEEAFRAIQEDRYPRLLAAIDSLAEVGVRAVEKSKLALSTETLQAFPPLVKVFFESSKSISHAIRDVQVEPAGGDLESFTLFYLLQRLELINDYALRNRQETVCRQMVMIMGKIIVQGARLDLSMVPFPTHFLTKFGLKSQQHHFDEVGVLTTSTLLAVAKTILDEIDLSYAELQDAFHALLAGLDALAKGAFKRRKELSIKVLTQPFLDLKTFFQADKIAPHRDTPALLQEIDRILEEYAVLEQVMQTLPPIPDLEGSEGVGPRDGETG